MSFDIFSNRTYREHHMAKDLVYFRATIESTDLHIGAKSDLSVRAVQAVKEARKQVEAAIARRPVFKSSFSPLPIDADEGPVVNAMLQAAAAADVGPMAAVAGAISEYVGRALLPFSDEVIVENGGDIFLFGGKTRKIAILAGDSPLTEKLALLVEPYEGLGVCTSSATVGHSISLGRTDASLIVAKTGALADAAASMLGNAVNRAEDIPRALEDVLSVPDVYGALVIIGDKLGAKGQLRLCRL
ncbi:MAG: UPF0280 family protein [Oscillospiraceae bacterium]|nr:UPF0280 family protein [Oscillospiraceae bacterium]